MPPTLSAGDLVLRLLGDSTDVEGAINRVNAEAQAKLQPSADMAKALGDSLETAGKQGVAAGEDITKASDKTTDAVKDTTKAQKESGKAAESAAKEQTQAQTEVQGALDDTVEMWMRLAEATIEEEKASIANQEAKDNLRDAIDKAARAGEDNEESIAAVAQAEIEAGVAAAKLEEAQRRLTDVANQLAEAEDNAGQSFKMFGAEAQSASNATDDLGDSTHHARDSVDLLAGTLGIRLPRELKKYIASLEGVAPALNAAFRIAIVLAFIKVLIDAGNELGDFLSKTFVYTEAMKTAYAEQVKLNDAILQQSEKLKELKKAYDLIGLDGAPRTQAEIRQLRKELEDTEQQWRRSRDAVYDYDKGERQYTQTAEARNAADLLSAKLHSQIIVQRQQLANLDKELATTKSEDKTQDIALARIAAQKEINDQIAAAELAHQHLMITLNQKGYGAIIQAQREFEAKQYQNELESLEKTKALLEKNPKKNVQELIAVNAKIEIIESQHNAKLEENESHLNEVLLKMRKQRVETVETEQKAGTAIIVTEATKMVDAVLKAYDQLNIQGTQNINEHIHAAEQAYKTLATSAVASIGDIIQAELILAQLRLQKKQDSGGSTQEEENAVERLQDKWAHLTGQVRANSREVDIWAKINKKGYKAVEGSFKELATRGVAALDMVADATANAIQQAILGEESFSVAMRKALAQQLAAWASQDAISAVRMTALGFARLAHHDYKGAGDAFTSAAIYASVAAMEGVAAAVINPKDKEDNGDSIEGKAVNTQAGAQNKDSGGSGGSDQPAERQPVTTSNTFSFGSGALVTSPTMLDAVVGDARSAGARNDIEAIIPLENEHAVARIASAIVAQMPERQMGNGDVHIHNNVKGLISADTLSKVTKKMSKEVRNGKVRLTSSNSHRVTRKG